MGLIALAGPIDAAPASSGAAPSELLAALASKAAAFRLIASRDVHRIEPLLDEAERKAAAPLTELTPAFKAAMVAGSLEQSLDLVDVTGQDGLVAWWNPFDDTVIASRWAVVDGTWRLRQLGALLGSDLVGASSSSPPDKLDWPNHGADVGSALATQNATGIARLRAAVQSQALPPMLGDAARQARAWSTLIERHAQNAFILSAAVKEPGLADYRARLVAALLRKPGVKTLDPGFAHALLRLPPAARATLRPVLVVKVKTVHAVVVQSPLKPAFVIIADVDDARSPLRFRTVPLLGASP